MMKSQDKFNQYLLAGRKPEKYVPFLKNMKNIPLVKRNYLCEIPSLKTSLYF